MGQIILENVLSNFNQKGQQLVIIQWMDSCIPKEEGRVALDNCLTCVKHCIN
jgi:hypothetical protein